MPLLIFSFVPYKTADARPDAIYHPHIKNRMVILVIIMQQNNCPTIKRYCKFVHNLVQLTAGGPPSGQLVTAIENGTVNMESVAHMLYGYEFESYTEAPQSKMNSVRENYDYFGEKNASTYM